MKGAMSDVTKTIFNSCCASSDRSQLYYLFGRKQLKLEWIQPLWNESQGLKPDLCDTPGSIGFPFWTSGRHSVQPFAL